MNYGLRLGWLLDSEADGQPTSLADGDDLNGAAPDDEDGVVFTSPIIPGTWAQVDVYAGVNTNGVSGFAYLQGWVDFNADGDWLDAGEQIFTDQVVTFTGVANTNALSFPVPVGATTTQTVARFRLSTTRGLGQAGPAPDGEVEDYAITIANMLVDWGDVPDTLQTPLYPTLSANNGAHHILSMGMFLGNLVDPEPDGQPNLACTGDDIDLLYPSSGDDEDGVVFTTQLQPGGSAGVDVLASMPGLLDAWVDFNNDGDWADSGERIFTAQPLAPGANSLIFGVPTTTITGNPLVSRFRYSSSGVASYTGMALDGEVEDLLTPIVISLEQGADYGDAPDPTYPTLLPAGATHTIIPGVMLGATIDSELNGQPDPQALGDDSTGLDDEDGILFTTKVIAGQKAYLDVITGTAPATFLDAWIDYNADGIWAHPGEHLWGGASVPLASGLNAGIKYSVPGLPAQALGPTFARFRLSSTGGLTPTGAAADGEVEDYMVELYQPAPTNLVITNLTFNASNTVSTVEWTAQPGIIYQMEASTNLTTNVWFDVGTRVTGPNNAQTNGITADTNKFYRVYAPGTP